MSVLLLFDVNLGGRCMDRGDREGGPIFLRSDVVVGSLFFLLFRLSVCVIFLYYFWCVGFLYVFLVVVCNWL